MLTENPTGKYRIEIASPSTAGQDLAITIKVTNPTFANSIQITTVGPFSLQTVCGISTLAEILEPT